MVVIIATRVDKIRTKGDSNAKDESERRMV
jgi:hypothetical protein